MPRPPLPATCAVLVFALLRAPGAGAAVLSGVVHTPSGSGVVARASSAYAGQASALPGRHETRRGAPSDAVVYVKTLPPGADLPAAESAPPALSQRDQSFEPRVLPIAVGTRVAFPNFDPIFHNVFSVSPARRFDLGKYGQGQSRQVTFEREGVVHVFCDIHSSMAAWIVVLPHRAFAQPGADGAFRLPDLPPGRYRLVAWHPDLPALERDVDLSAGGATVELRW